MSQIWLRWKKNLPDSDFAKISCNIDLCYIETLDSRSMRILKLQALYGWGLKFKAKERYMQTSAMNWHLVQGHWPYSLYTSTFCVKLELYKEIKYMLRTLILHLRRTLSSSMTFTFDIETRGLIKPWYIFACVCHFNKTQKIS